MTIRTRFAPSPTGFMHVGNLRTALYDWLYTRKMCGKFILRIEDTDIERSTEAAIQVILDSMKWLGLNYDEGPFYQSQRTARYKAVIDHLLKSGKAYRCYCSKARLEKLRADQLKRKEKPRYDGHCRNLQGVRDDPFVVRFKNPKEGVVRFEEGLLGVVEFKNSELDDLIIARQNGSPTYNFTVVIDDWDMEITHVIRGADHVNNTPRQINIMHALGIKPPIYVHLPMILGPDGKRLSKRHGAMGVLQYREEGILPEALLNYLVRLGWSHGDQEIFSVDEMVKCFDFKGLQKSPATFNQDKLLWLNQHYLKTLPPKKVAKELEWQMQRKNIDYSSGPPLTEVIKAQAERCKTLNEMAEKSRYFYEEIKKYDEKAARKNLTQNAKPILQFVHDELEKLKDWNAESIHQIILTAAEKFQVKLGQVAQPIRVAMTSGTISPPIDITLQLIGKDRVLFRLQHAIHFIQS